MSEPVEGPSDNDEPPAESARTESGKHRRTAGRHVLGAEPTQAIGTEDVLSGTAAAAPRRSWRDRRSPWNRPRDRVIAVVITVIAAVAGVVVWAGSESRATVSETAAPGPPLPPSPTAVPGSLTELWQAPNGAAPVPVAAGRAVVTGSGGEIDGRDPLTGQIRWRYSRDRELCTMITAWSRALAVYREDGENNERDCGEVIELNPDTGHRMAQRTGSAELGTQLVTDGSYVTAFGSTFLDTWRDDLVETDQYGQVPALVNPDKQPRVGCTYGSIAAAASRVSVVERCPHDPGDRITVFRAAPTNFDEPQVSFSQILPGYQARMVAMSGDYTAVAMPQQRVLVRYGPDGVQAATYPLDVPAADLANDPPGGVPATSTAASNVYWFSGSTLLALSRDNLTPKWTLSSALGPGVLYDHQFVVPIPGGLAVLNENDGSTIRTIAVDRRGYTGPIRLSTIGPVLLEQRGDTVVALR